MLLQFGNNPNKLLMLWCVVAAAAWRGEWNSRTHQFWNITVGSATPLADHNHRMPTPKVARGCLHIFKRT